MNAHVANFASAWAQWVAAASWQIAVLVALVALAAFLSRRLSARFRYLLWMLVVLKALTPPSIGAVWSIGNWAAPQRLRELTVRIESASAEAPPVVAPGKAMAGPQGMEGQAEGGSPQPWSTSVVLSIVWATGFAGLIGLIVMRYRRLTRALGRADEVDEGPLRVAVEKLALRLGRDNPPPVLLSDAVTSPFLFGLVRPRIVLPANLPEALSADQLEDVLLHELIHWRRRDVAAGWLQIFVQALFWFHPLVWLAGAQLRHERECACDEAALESGCSQARRYGESLLSVLLAARGRSAVALGFLGIFERNTRLQRRLEEIMNQETKVRRLSVWGWLALALFAAACVPMASISPADSAKPAGDRIDWTSKLTENQLVFMQWTDRMFDRILDRRDFSAWKQADRDALRDRCLRALGGPQNQEYLEAINTLGALGDRKAVKPLLAIATDRVGDDCRDNWMAARALGMIGDPSAIPDLIHLTYHTNLNTHLWAQISLVRMTGLNLGADYMKWGAWWNGRGGRPAFKPEKIRWWDDPRFDQASTIEALAKQDQDFIDKIKGRRPAADSPSGAADALKDTWIITFKAKAPYQPASAGALLDTFNEHYPNGVQTHHFKAERQDGAWVGKICVETVAGRDALEKTLGRNPKLIELAAEKATPESFAALTGKPAAPAQAPAGPPRIVSTTPQVGATGVDPATREITVTFDRDMGGGMSWTGGGPDYPRVASRPHWLDSRTCVLPVTLETGKYYRVGINSTSHQNFRSASGYPAQPSAIYFTTVGASAELEAQTRKPAIVSFDPPNGAAGVDPNVKEIRITFNVAMGGGFSWTGGDDVPPCPEGRRPYWTPDRKTCVRPVALQPQHTYRVGLNSPSHKNFQSEGGVPLDPVRYQFSTK